MEKKLTCVECPKGCEITVTLNGDKIENVHGNECPRGRKYAESEVVCPLRVLTSTVKCTSGEMVSVKTDKPIKKSEIFDLMKTINEVKVAPPVKIGQVILKDIADGVDLIATSNTGDIVYK